MSERVVLTVTQGTYKGKRFVFKGVGRCAIGRDVDCQMRFSRGPESQFISRHHCLLTIAAPLVGVQDLGSRNGTFVNDTRLCPPAVGPDPTPTPTPIQLLHDGDELRVGPLAMRVHIVQSRAHKQRRPRHRRRPISRDAFKSPD